MISPPNITVSLEMAEKLKEAGWPQDQSVLFWQADVTHAEGIRVSLGANSRSMYEENVAAPTAEEILRRLPVWWQVNPHGQSFCVQCPDKIYPTFIEDTLANAAAAMYCYLAENKLLPAS